VGQSLRQPAHRSNQCSAKVIVGAFRTLQEAARPGRVQGVAFAGKKVHNGVALATRCFQDGRSDHAVVG
jgi:hypothetical protein